MILNDLPKFISIVHGLHYLSLILMLICVHILLTVATI